MIPEIPEENEFLNRCRMFQRDERRDLYYTVATAHVSDHLNDPASMANAVALLLLNWNWGYYRFGKRYGPLDFEKLEACISKNYIIINNFRDRDISTLSEEDDPVIRNLFNDFLEATMLVSEKIKDRKSPVSVAKALHVLVPTFFPLWDSSIAENYAKSYVKKYESKCEEYVYFCKQIKCIYQHVRNYQGLRNDEILSKKNLIKLIDEYNYSKYTA
ncbi:MAG: hypothetical protein PHY47_21800 [Lachnospiraceae bacterium]|nr:hypothetical protein [Lachnospiraceae bacterium]MDD4247905.1 hypothetical protein [Methanosarcina sp.]